VAAARTSRETGPVTVFSIRKELLSRFDDHLNGQLIAARFLKIALNDLFRVERHLALDCLRTFV
jgi:hypothetical protein